MSQQVFPTKGNLIEIKKSLALARLGFDLLDRKRNILIREMMLMIGQANEVQSKIDSTFSEAYLALQRANVSLGICGEIASAVPEETGMDITYRSVMGVEIPLVSLTPEPIRLHYGFSLTNSLLDEAYFRFYAVKLLTAQLAEIENGVYRLAYAIKKIQKRANALKNVIIPRQESEVKFIADVLDERDREEFSRLKVIKSGKKTER